MTPFKMIFQELYYHEPKEVYVFNFIHNTYEPLDTSALCWDPAAGVWLTIPISSLKPVIEDQNVETPDKASKKSLLE